jgi:hypothetical protein
LTARSSAPKGRIRANVRPFIFSGFAPVDRRCARASLWPYWDEQPLTDTERAEAAAAIDFLRRQGRTDAEIRAWLLMQRARYKWLKFNKGDYP